MTMDASKSVTHPRAMFKISPYLAHGCVSPRYLYWEVKRYEKAYPSRKNKSTGWIIHELIWRDFVRFGSMYFGDSIFKIGGPQNIIVSQGTNGWDWRTPYEIREKKSQTNSTSSFSGKNTNEKNSDAHQPSGKEIVAAKTDFHRWVAGTTGLPFVDSFMRELLHSGYCNHMGRETAGWFLAGDLGIDWRCGAEWFESKLLDYEPTANWFNWTYRCLTVAGRGHSEDYADIKRNIPAALRVDGTLQTMELLIWGTQHDPESVFMQRWIPELSALEGHPEGPIVIREPWRLGLPEAGMWGGRRARHANQVQSSSTLTQELQTVHRAGRPGPFLKDKELLRGESRNPNKTGEQASTSSKKTAAASSTKNAANVKGRDAPRKKPVKERIKRGLRPVGVGKDKIEVKRSNLEKLQKKTDWLYSEGDCAIALWRVWEDVDLAADLLLEEWEQSEEGQAWAQWQAPGLNDDRNSADEDLAKAIALSFETASSGGVVENTTASSTLPATASASSTAHHQNDDEDADLARALALSIETNENVTTVETTDQALRGSASKEDDNPRFGSFTYGVSYPFPIIQPVSRSDALDCEWYAREAQQKRIQQNEKMRVTLLANKGSRDREAAVRSKKWSDAPAASSGSNVGSTSNEGETHRRSHFGEKGGAKTREAGTSLSGMKEHSTPGGGNSAMNGSAEKQNKKRGRWNKKTNEE
ncbi:unnamed protein product [Amoebophrya sp. A25]|nr:unnamed protein product [Amoebophrya sp. A25]|eukprot:GSA25T00014261001.1